jgi:hypothetical protein
MKGLTKGEKQEVSRSLHPGVIINDLWHLREVRCDKPVMCRNPLELSRKNESSITYPGARLRRAFRCSKPSRTSPNKTPQ